MVKKAVKCCCSNNLQNDYKSEEINSQDSEHEDKKSDDKNSGYDDEEETYAYHKETLCTKCALMFDCSSTTLSVMATNLSAKNATTTSNSRTSASNTSVSSTRGGVSASTPASCPSNGQQQLKCVVEHLTIVHGRKNVYFFSLFDKD